MPGTSHPTRSVPTRAIRAGYKVCLLALAWVLLIVLVGCRPAWQVTLLRPEGDPFLVNREVLESLHDLAEEVDGQQQVPLERVLLAGGHTLVERLAAVDANGMRREYDWAAVADDAWWLEDGRLEIGGEPFRASRLEVTAPALAGQVQARVTDVAPAAASALGLAPLASATGHTLQVPRASHVLLLFLDGFGYVRYVEALQGGLIPHLAALEPPLIGLTTYPPITVVASASLLTGASPDVHGVDRRGLRSTEVETLFDVATRAGLRVVAVEGESLAFNLRNAQVQLSGDRDGNGGTDDNVLASTLAVLEEGMPDLLFVHLHGIDDAGHTYGPGAPEEQAKVAEVDAAVGRLVEAVPPDTLVFIFADHGLHRVDEEDQLGNHGHMIERDMFIPIWVMRR